MNILFVGVRKNEEDITSAPQKISNCLFNTLAKEHDNLYYYGIFEEEKPNKISELYKINDKEVKGTINNLGGFIKRNKIDVVYFARYHSIFALYITLLKFIYGFKIVYTVHGIVKKEKEINESFKFYSVLSEAVLLANTDKIVVISHALKDELLKYYPKIDEKKIEVINNGVSVTPIKEHINIRELYNLEASKKVVLTVGVRKIKNIETLIEGFVNNNDLYNSSYLLIAGEDDTEYAKDLINKYKKYDGVKFIGYVDTNSMNNLYSQIDLYVQISKFETFGMSIVETLLHQKNVLISSKLPIAQYFDCEEVNFYNEDEDDLGQVILEGLQNKHPVNIKGYNKVKQLFDWEKIAREYYEAFSEAHNS